MNPPPVCLSCLAVLVGVMLGRFGSMVLGLETMAVRYVRVMGRFFMIAGLVMLGGCAMMSGCMLMMFSSLLMMFGTGFGHGILLDANLAAGRFRGRRSIAS